MLFPFGYEAFEKKIRETRSNWEPRGDLSCPAELVTSHTPRRSFSGAMYRAGVSLQTLKELTGHKSTDRLLLYVNRDYVHRAEAAKKLKF
eukprot:g19149.t1